MHDITCGLISRHQGDLPPAQFMLPFQKDDGDWVYLPACQHHQDEWLREGLDNPRPRPPGYLLVEI